jgi:uncharacterized membrane protein YeiH
MQYFFEHFAVAVSAISGVLAGKGKRVDLFGVVVLALVTALGGGTIRDLALGSRPVFWIKDPTYIYTGAGFALLAFFVSHLRELPNRLLLIADAFGLALFTQIGLEKSLAMDATQPIAIVLGVVTGVAGGMIRDILVGEIPLVFQQEIYLYATAALIGAALYVALEWFIPAPTTNRLIGIASILVLRLAAIQWKLTLPILEEDTPPSIPPKD